ncbi:kit ligand-like [Acipenser oxyrinchus oxyrinchus]|uniref:Kit ligand n=1 Tax=Acipenser oxyrinchus oxyrinchus TaxID=40147 RepID=A0AAD8DHP6_ACIOX|nr:kit ligand-like [Acipenser oxyrinchus oxyrinchus]
MKKTKIWITAFIYPCLLFCFTFVEHSCGLGNVITDDVNTIPILKGNIPNDYIIKVRYVPKSEELNDICWLMLNIYELQLSLNSLAVKFAETSSNKENITVLIDMVMNMRRPFQYEEEVIDDYHCHYQDGNFNTSVYFDYLKKMIETYELHERQFISPDCVSPPCPTSETTTLVAGSITIATELLIMNTTACVSASDCNTQETRHDKNTEAKTNTQGAEKLHIPLYSLLLIPVFGIFLVLTWKHTKKRRMNTETIQENETMNFEDNVNQEGPAAEKVTLQAVVEL